MKPESSIPPLPPQVEAWLSEQPDADRRTLEETWRLADHGSPPMTPSDVQRKHDVWAAVSGSTRRTDRGAMPRPRRHRVASRTLRWVAAVAVVAFLVSAAYLLRPVSVEAPHGTLAEAVLPDGSTIHLNSGSTLTYRAHFFDAFGTRSVSLDGEAFFDVATDEVPFVVMTANARTTVLGTKFNVRARTDEGDVVTQVVVAEGRVRVERRESGSDGVVLAPEQQTLVRAAQAPTAPSVASLERELAWRHGGFAFADQPFRTIFAEIERRFDVSIDAPIDVRADTYAIYLQSPKSAEDILTTLTRANGLRYRKTANGFEVYRP